MATKYEESLELQIVAGQSENLTQSDIHQDSLLTMSTTSLTASTSSEGETLSILVVGETGVGKSTLINSFLGKKIDKKAQVSHGAKPTSHDPIEKHTGKIGPNRVIIYDSKGLIDVNPKCKDSQLMKEFQEAISDDKIALIFICQRMFGRYNESTDHIVEMIAKYFKKREAYTYIWERCILILTQANTYYFDDDVNESEEMGRVMREWGIRFKEGLQKYGVPDDIADNIPVCATGNKRNVALPVTDNWIIHLYDVCQWRCPPNLRDVVMNLKSLRKDSLKYSIGGGAFIGAVVGAIIIPGLGAVPGVTIGALIGWGLGKKTLSDMEEKLMKNAKERQLSNQL